jgi:hypothetical protein
MTLSYNTSVKRRGFNKIKSRSLNSKFKPYNILCANQTCKDFIQASKIPSKLLFKHCSCYSAARVSPLDITHDNVSLRFKLCNKDDNFEWNLIAVSGAAQQEEKENFLSELI